MLVDSHCHFNLLDLSIHEQGMASVLANAAQSGVGFFLNVATEPANWNEVLQLAIQHDNMVASVGLHPSDACENEPSADVLLQAANNSKIVAIGETGLDYFHKETTECLQKERFRRHIQVARTLKKPLIIHTRQARADTIAILKEERAQDVGGVMHCFTETLDMAYAAMDLNFMISFSGIVTFKKAQELKEVAKKIPLDKMLLETDAPFLTPEPFRGQPNQPANVFYVADYIAQIRKDSFEQIAEQTTENFFQLFKDAQYALRQSEL